MYIYAGNVLQDVTSKFCQHVVCIIRKYLIQLFQTVKRVMFGFTCIIIGAELRVVKKMFKIKKNISDFFLFLFKSVTQVTWHITAHDAYLPVTKPVIRVVIIAGIRIFFKDELKLFQVFQESW